jgi:hypothetical protein
VVWLSEKGKAGVRKDDGSLHAAVNNLLESGALVLGADLFFQSEKDNLNRLVANPREFAGYTYGYNHALFAQRTHDVLSLVSFLKNSKSAEHPPAREIHVAAWGACGPIAAAARAVSGDAIHKAVLETGGFRFSSLLDYQHPQFLPGGAKYLDVPGMLALGAPHATWVAGEKSLPPLVHSEYAHHRAQPHLTIFDGAASQRETAAVQWLLQ